MPWIFPHAAGNQKAGEKKKKVVCIDTHQSSNPRFSTLTARF